MESFYDAINNNNQTTVWIVGSFFIIKHCLSLLNEDVLCRTSLGYFKSGQKSIEMMQIQML